MYLGSDSHCSGSWAPALAQQGLHKGQRARHALLSIPTALGSAARSARSAVTQGSCLNGEIMMEKKGKVFPIDSSAFGLKLIFISMGLTNSLVVSLRTDPTRTRESG